MTSSVSSFSFYSGLHIIHSLDEVNFIQNLVFYIEAAYKTAVSTHFGIDLKHMMFIKILDNPFLLLMLPLIVNQSIRLLIEIAFSLFIY